jgi:3,4-dihydroxy 2-butanone 4-phosphate synthase / GTP cyclohydrolase II
MASLKAVDTKSTQPAASVLSPVPEIISELKSGRMVILIDEEDRENEGDLVLAADFVTPEAINFMAKYGRGLICLTLTKERCEQLNLPLMTSENKSGFGTNFTMSIEAAEGVSSGISAADRARTVQAAVAFNAKPSDIVQPEIMKDDGTMARLPDLLVFAKEHNLKIGAITDLIQYRAAQEALVECVGERPITTAHGVFTLKVFREKMADATHLALVRGTPSPDCETLVRVHQPLSVIDALDAGDFVHSWSVPRALQRLSMIDVSKGEAAVLILLHEGETATSLKDRALSTKPLNAHKMDLRTYGVGAQILRSLGVGKMRVLAKPRRMPSMTGFDLEVVGYEADAA